MKTIKNVSKKTKTNKSGQTAVTPAPRTPLSPPWQKPRDNREMSVDVSQQRSALTFEEAMQEQLFANFFQRLQEMRKKQDQIIKVWDDMGYNYRNMPEVMAVLNH